MLVGRIRNEANVLMVTLPYAVAIEMRESLINSGRGKAIPIKGPGFGVRFLTDMVFDHGGFKLFFWKDYYLVIKEEEGLPTVD